MPACLRGRLPRGFSHTDGDSARGETANAGELGEGASRVFGRLRARVASQAWWEDLGQANIVNPHFNARAYAAEMCRRFPQHYSHNPKPRSEIPSERPVVERRIVDPLGRLLQTPHAFARSDGSAEE